MAVANIHTHDNLYLLFCPPTLFATDAFVCHRYQATAQPFLVFGILTTALAVGNHTF